MKLFHGTTADALADIRINGLRTDKGGENWTVSDAYVYFWSPEAIMERDDCDMEQAEAEARRMAEDSGSFGLGFAKDCRLVILEIELPDEMEPVIPDESCDNMEGAVCTYENVPFSCVTAIHISNDLSLLKGYFLSFCLKRDMSARSLTYTEQKVAELFAKSDSFCDILSDVIEWE